MILNPSHRDPIVLMEVFSIVAHKNVMPRFGWDGTLAQNRAPAGSREHLRSYSRLAIALIFFCTKATIPWNG